MVSEILRVENLSVEFNGQKAVEDVNFSLKRGEVLAVVGPNGSGKSVLFRALLGLVPHSGKVTWQKDKKIGYVPQKLAVEKDLPLTAREFMGLRGIKYHEAERNLEEVGLRKKKGSYCWLLDKKLGQLSSGQFQRLLIANSLIGKPDVLLFDEPTAGIDIAGEETIYELLRKLQSSNDLTVIVISHDLNTVHDFADLVLCLNRKQVCFGRPHDVLDHRLLHHLYGEEIKRHHPDNHNLSIL
jgi:zinc transport system ATP-binding protein